MNRQRLTSLVRKEFRQLFRDPSTMRILLIAPLIQLVIHAWGCSLDLKGVRLGVVIESPCPEARQLVQAIEATGAFEVRRSSASPADLQPWLDTGAVQIALHIPPGFERALARGEAPVVQVLSDGADANTATIAFQYLSGAATQWAREARMDYIRRHPAQAVRFASPQVDLHPRYWYNPDLRSIEFVVPGVIMVILLTLPMSQAAAMVVRERELGTLEQLSVTPLRGAELLIAKTVPTATMGLVQAVGIGTIAVFGFGVPMRGSLFFLLVVIMLYLLNSMGLGLLISVISRTQMQSQLVSNFIITYLIMMSGFLFPIANMPGWLQPWTYLLPTRYGMEVIRGVFLKGQGFADLWPQMLALAGIGSLAYLAGLRLFKKRVD
jgi:ABC-2 type transport system permease protein